MTEPLPDTAMHTCSEDGDPGERHHEPLRPEDLPVLEELQRPGTPVVSAVEERVPPKH